MADHGQAVVIGAASNTRAAHFMGGIFHCANQLRGLHLRKSLPMETSLERFAVD
jgi:hypothetical protein